MKLLPEGFKALLAPATMLPGSVAEAGRAANGAGQAIVSVLQKHLTDDQPRGEINDEQIRFDRTTLATLISRIEVQRNQLLISMKSTNGSSESEALSISWHKPLAQNPAATRHSPRERPSRARRTTRSSPVRHSARTPLASGNRNWIGYQRRTTGKAGTMHRAPSQPDALARVSCSSTGQGSCRRTPPARHQHRALAGSRR